MSNAKTGKNLILVYFRQSYEHRVETTPEGETQLVTITEQPFTVESLHLAWSHNGRHWNALNNNESVWPDQWLRDPFIGRGTDSAYHLIATAGHHARSCVYARSHDLIAWEDVRLLPLMEGVPKADNIWAPEWFYDEVEQQYFLFWSTSFGNYGWENSRLWYSRTRDFTTFTPPQILFEPPYSVIDGSLLHHEGVYYLFHKEEEFGAQKGERRAIRLATSTHLNGPYTIHHGPLNTGQIVPIITEGPAIFADPVNDGWLLSYDFCMRNDYGISSSEDLLNWQEITDVSFPSSARHGSVVFVSNAELDALQKKFSSR